MYEIGELLVGIVELVDYKRGRRAAWIVATIIALFIVGIMLVAVWNLRS